VGRRAICGHCVFRHDRRGRIRQRDPSPEVQLVRLGPLPGDARAHRVTCSVTHFPADRSGGFDLIRVRALRADQREGVAAERGAGAATLIQVKVRKNE
jgi:hypothetical protein